ncbi:MAG: Ig-like domain-containing protein [Candidatus Sulfotelmatobacter sp.]
MKNSTTSKTPVGVQLNPTSVSMSTGGQEQFVATVQGTSNTAVTWSVDSVSGGNSTDGTITTSGMYTAPSQAGTHSVTATSVADSSKSATAAVTVQAVTITISPVSALLNPGATQQFTANLQGFSNSSVTWSVDGTVGGNSSLGTISSSGLYTAPSAIGTHTISATSVVSSSTSAQASATVVNIARSAVLTYHNDDARDGAYTEEVTLMPSNVNSNQFGKLVSYSVDGQIYGQPLYVPQLQIPNQGTRDVVFVATQSNSVYAFDADATSTNPTTLWQVNLGTPVTVYDSGGPWPSVGILSTPVIDSTTNTIYVVAEVQGASPPFWLHALDITTGVDKVPAVGVTGSYGGDSLSSSCYQRMGLALNPVTNWIYIAFGSCSNGFVFAYDKSSLAQEAIFESTNAAKGGGFWSSGGAPAIDDKSGNVYLMSGTDLGDAAYITPPPAYTQTGYNDSFLNLNPSTLSVQSYFSPDNNYVLAENDADLGSGSPILIAGNSQYPLELIGGGKDGNVFVLNPLNMGGFNGTNGNLQTIYTGVAQYDNIFDTPVYWNGNIYFHPAQDVIRAFSWNAGADAGEQLSTNPTSVGAAVFAAVAHGATASLSANGNNNGIVWDIDNSTYVGNNPVASGPAVLHAYDATNLANELYNSAQAGSRDQAGLALKFTVPTIANGRVFVPTATELDIYGLLGK